MSTRVMSALLSCVRRRVTLGAVRVAVMLIGTMVLLGVPIGSFGRALTVQMLPGDLLVAGVSGTVAHYSPAGVLKNTLVVAAGGYQTGMCLDEAGSVHTTNWSSSTLSKFNNGGDPVLNPWITGASASPESCEMMAGGDFLAGLADGARTLLKYDAAGALLATYTPTIQDRGIDWIDLATDDCTVYYTSEGSTVFRFNVCANAQLSAFATGLTRPCFGLRIRANGEVLVACQSQVVRLSAAGAVLQTYSSASLGGIRPFSLDLDLDGTSFWVGDFLSGGSSNGLIARVDIASGSVVQPLTNPAGATGLLVYDGPATPPPPIPGETIATCNEGELKTIGGKCEAEPVSMLTGSFMTHEIDLLTPGVGVSFEWARSYTSGDTSSGRLGPGWVDSYSAFLDVQGNGDVIAHAGSGQQVFFEKQANGSYLGSAGTRATLTLASGTYTLVRNNQTKYTFNTSGRLLTMVDRNEQGLSFAYDGSGNLTTVTDAANRAATVAYNAAGLVASVTTADGRSVSYGYDTAGRLTSVTDARGKVWTYAYAGATSLLTSEQDPVGNFPVRNTYDLVTGRVVSQLDALGNQTIFTWDEVNLIATMTTPGGGVWFYDFDSNGRLVEEIDPEDHNTLYDWDADVNLVSTTNARGHETTMSYDARGNMLSKTGPTSQSYAESWTYTAKNDVATYTDRRGNTTTFGYDGDGNLVSVTGPNPGGGSPVTSYTRNATTGLVTAIRKPNQQGAGSPKDTVYVYETGTTGNVLSVTSPEGNKSSYGYDNAGRVTSMVEPRGNVTGCGCASQYTWNYTYDATGHRTQVKSPDPDGAGPLPRLQTDFAFDDVGRLGSVTNAKGKTWSYTYNAANERTRETAPNTSHTDVEYDTRGNTTATVDQLGKRTTFTYDLANRRTSMVEPRGNEAGADPDDFRWSYQYDQVNNQTGVFAPDPDGAGPLARPFTEFNYDHYSRVESVFDQTGFQQVLYAYDGNGNVVSETAEDPDGSDPLTGSVTQYGYDVLNRRTSLTDPLNKITGFVYDKNGNLTSSTTPLGFKTSYTYDADNRQLTRSDPRENVAGCSCPGKHTWTYAYDPASNVLSETAPDPDGAGPLTASVTQYVYDKIGQRTSRTDALNHTVSWKFDELGNLTATTTHDTKTTALAFDANTNDLLSRTDARGKVTSWVYDLAHRTTTMKRAAGSPLEKTWTYTYDPAGRLLTTVDAKANAASNPALGTTSRAYDPVGRLTGIDYSDATPDITYSYNQENELMLMQDGAGDHEYAYDNADRLVYVNEPFGAYDYEYNPRNQVTKRFYPDFVTTADYSYDDDGRMSNASSGGLTTSYAYNPVAQLLTTTLPSGNGHVETRSYDNAGRLSEVKNTKGAATLSKYTLTRDKVGNPTKIANTGTTTQTFLYDVNDRLTEVCFKANGAACTAGSDPYVRFTYDGVGNRLTEARNGAATVTYTYNDLNQLTQRGTTAYTYDDNGNQTAAGTRSFAWNNAGQLTSSTQAGTTVTYTYDGNGNRLTAATGPGVNTVRSSWDINNPLPMLTIERDGNNTLLRRYLNGLDTISMTTPAGAFYMHYDNQGSATNLTNSTGVTQWTRTFEPFGAKRTETKNVGSAPTLPVQYTGEYIDPTTGLYNLRARHLDPAAGRFTSYDPVNQAAAVPYSSDYAYVANRPTRFADPSGMDFCDGGGFFDLRPCAFIKPWVDAYNFGQGVADAELRVEDQAASIISGYIRMWYDMDYNQAMSDLFWNAVEACDADITGCAVAIGEGILAEVSGCIKALGGTDARATGKRCAGLVISLGGTAGVGKTAAESLAKSLGRQAQSVGMLSVAGREVWALSPLTRGVAIEDALAATEYASWYHIGAEMNGYFPLVDFQLGNKLVSLKTVDPGSPTAISRMENEIRNLADSGAFVDGVGSPTQLIMDIRVPPGQEQLLASLVKFGEDLGVAVTIMSFP